MTLSARVLTERRWSAIRSAQKLERDLGGWFPPTGEHVLAIRRIRSTLQVMQSLIEQQSRSLSRLRALRRGGKKLAKRVEKIKGLLTALAQEEKEG